MSGFQRRGDTEIALKGERIRVASVYAPGRWWRVDARRACRRSHQRGSPPGDEEMMWVKLHLAGPGNGTLPGPDCMLNGPAASVFVADPDTKLRFVLVEDG